MIRGRLWRATDPSLDPARRQALTNDLMTARREVWRHREDLEAVAAARRRVDAAKVALGERGPPWWSDGAPDYNRRMARNTPYAEWWETVEDAGAAD